MSDEAAPLRDDRQNPEATRDAVAAAIMARPAAHWRDTLEPRDCCCTVVRTLEEALSDPHWTARGLLDAQAQEPGGRRMVSVPVPLAPVFRERAAMLKCVPASGADTARVLGQARRDESER